MYQDQDITETMLGLLGTGTSSDQSTFALIIVFTKYPLI